MDKYIVSARKYRPTTFDSVVGQQALTTTLKNAIAQGKLAHAYLFCGPRGVGKTTCARIFAKTINCLSPTPEGEACNHCESCVAFNEQRSYNIHELDAASNNSVDGIRELIDQVQIPPQVGRYKVFIIDEVHMLSTAAFNAFLKTLEEPPAHAIFILATTEKHKILPTILSRCQIYDFNRITVADTVHHLAYVAGKEGITYEEEALHVIAEKADGAMRDALSIFDRVSSFCEGHITYQKVIDDLNVLDYDEYFAMTDTLLKGDIPSALLRFDRILSRGFEGNYFIGGLAGHFRDLLMARDAQTLPLLEVSDQTRQRYHEQAMRCQPRFIYRALKLCNDCDMNYRTARNKRLLVELTLIEVAQTAVGEDDTGCGLGPVKTLKPIFHTAAAASAAASAATAASSQATTQPAATQPAATQSGAQTAQTTPAVTAQPAAAQQPIPAAQSAAQTQGSPIDRLKSSLNQSTQHQQHVRAAHTISLTSLAQQARQATAAPQTPSPGSAAPQPHTAQAAPASPVTAEQPAPSTQPAPQPADADFTADELNFHWLRFAQELPQEQTGIAERMKMTQLTLHSDRSVEIPVSNEMAAQFYRPVLPTLTAYLKRQLHNEHIVLKLKIGEPEAGQVALSRPEQFKGMLDKSPELRKLCDELELELS